MAVTPKALVDGTLLASSAATLYTAPLTAVVRAITFCNTDSVDRTFTVYIVKAGGTVGNQYAILRAISIKPKQTIIDDSIHVLEVNDFISAFADAAGQVSIRVDGSEVS